MYTVTFTNMAGYSFTRTFSTFKEARKTWKYLVMASHVGDEIAIFRGNKILARYEK